MPLCRNRWSRVDSEESAAARGLLGPGDPLVCVYGGSDRVPASGAREGERWASRAAAAEVPCARVRPSCRAHATEPVSSVGADWTQPRNLGAHWSRQALVRPCSQPLVSKLGGTARRPVKGARRVTHGPRRGRHLGTSHPAPRRGAVRCGVPLC